MSHPGTTASPANALTAPLGAMEPNVIIAGLEAAVAIWTARAALLGEPLIPCITSDWRWSYVLVAIAALLGIVLLGLAVDGVAGPRGYPLTPPPSGVKEGP